MRDLADRTFWISKEDEIKDGEVTDYYFLNVEKALRDSGRNPLVTVEVYTRKLPYQDEWGIVAGIYEVAKLLEGLPVDVWAMEEGEIFQTASRTAAYEPVMRIRGRYADFARYETSILGFLCSASGIATKAARLRMLAGRDKTLLSFGTRRAHPALAPLIERCAYMAGFNGFSNTVATKLLGMKASGTMPHSFVLCFDDQREAWRAFDRALPPDAPRIALVDTLFDEKTESIMALETLGERLYGVRLDTPSSRRGEWRKIIEEVRWELSLRGGKNVKIFVSGGIDEKEVAELADIVDGFGIGTSVSDAPSIDFNMKVVEVEGPDGRLRPRSKRGDLSGAKEVFRNSSTMHDYIAPLGWSPPAGYDRLLRPLIEKGRVVREPRSVDEIRSELLSKLDLIRAQKPSVTLTA
ncbi:nicotinate phosphoribosyltransferase [Conexivisphaera calida]|uniref:nicotinate phosphoribosyltransferase n=1 Tax=Conexivisphaera calida TaxID=1874277 RepID=A0A4P2VKY1_9ARCH|nr:nicotinate phosphoribosyltransferase [Conexivisphaera calida]BBE41848.1 Nicotinate phosphoribosyltransferase [Conexivisphaera calida]